MMERVVICTINVTGIRGLSKRIEVENWMREKDLDVCIITETHLMYNETITFTNYNCYVSNFIPFRKRSFSQRKSKCQQGVLIAIRRNIVGVIQIEIESDLFKGRLVG